MDYGTMLADIAGSTGHHSHCECFECRGDVCEHGNEEGRCRKCELKAEAEREFEFQRDVIGPLCGFDQEASL